jgi:hypothetical protein
MAGKTIEEARAAQDAARTAQDAARTAQRSGSGSGTGRPRNNRNTANTANTATATATQSPANNKTTFTLHGKSYMLLPNAESTSSPQIVEIVESNNALSAISMQPYDEAEYMALLATTDDPQASLSPQSFPLSRLRGFRIL